MIGIAVTTFNRATHLDRLICEIKRMTVGEFFLVVCDDGSSDDTESVCRKHAVARIGSKNMGISWNKNRGLYALFEIKKCDVVFIIEDDVAIVSHGWNKSWQKAAINYGHVNLLDSNLASIVKEKIICGDGALNNPFLMRCISGACMAISKECFEKVGYLHPDFIGYGEEHIEFTRRCAFFGFGMKNGGYIHITEGLTLLTLPSMADKSSISKNREIGKRLNNIKTRINPFSDKERYEQIQLEMSTLTVI